MNIRPDEHLEKLAMNLFNIGALKFKAPTSPVEFNLRTVSHPEKAGPLTPSILRDIGQAFNTMLTVRKVKYAAVCGVPHAGVPLALYLTDFEGTGLNAGRAFVRLEKTTDVNGKRRIANASSRSPHLARTLLIDNVLNKAESKLEAIDALTEAGWLTTHTLVVIDRCQGGHHALRKRGVQTFSLFTLPWLVDFYASRGVISKEMAHTVKAYLSANT